MTLRVAADQLQQPRQGWQSIREGAFGGTSGRGESVGLSFDIAVSRKHMISKRWPTAQNRPKSGQNWRAILRGFRDSLPASVARAASSVSESASTCFRHGLRHSGITIAVEQSTAVGLSLDKVRAYSQSRQTTSRLRSSGRRTFTGGTACRSCAGPVHDC